MGWVGGNGFQRSLTFGAGVGWRKAQRQTSKAPVLGRGFARLVASSNLPLAASR